jgi:hypothetical protein
MVLPFFLAQLHAEVSIPHSTDFATGGTKVFKLTNRDPHKPKRRNVTKQSARQNDEILTTTAG